jgi:hypothetical protein
VLHAPRAALHTPHAARPGQWSWRAPAVSKVGLRARSHRLRSIGLASPRRTIQPPATAVYKLSPSAPTVAQGTNSGRHERNRSDTRSRRLSFQMAEGQPSHRGLTEPRPVACTRLRKTLLRPLRSSPRVLSDSVFGRMTSALVPGQTAAPDKAPLESGAGAKSGTPVTGFESGRV